jgi:hypothetical protein
MPVNPAKTKARAAIAAITRHSGADDPRIPKLQSDLAAIRLEERIKDDAPALTLAQRKRLALLLHPGR